MNRNFTFILYFFFVTNIFAFEKDSTNITSNSSIFNSSINMLLGGGNKNYHDDSFCSMAIRVESKSVYTSFIFEFENLINNETGYEGCFGEPEHYKKNYNTTFLKPQFGVRYKYIGVEFGVAIVNQTRGWCENILERRITYFYQLNFGFLDKYYLSIGSSDNFRVSLSDEIFEAGITMLFDQGLSMIKLESMRWGYGLLIKKKISERFIALGELYYYDEIQITRSERTSEVFDIRIGIGYLISDL